jgi:predicted MFS family arabinose efflux permease
MGLAPDGFTKAEAAAAPPPPSMPFREVMRSGYFYAVTVSYLFLLGAQVAGIAHLYRLANIRDGVDTAALALGVMAATSTVGRLLGGAVLLKVPSRTFALGLMLMQAVSLAALAWAHGRWTIVAGVTVFGLTMGNSLMMHPLLLVERFGTRDYGRIYSLSQLMTVGGLAGGASLVGVIFEWTGDYTIPYLTIACATLVGLAILNSTPVGAATLPAPALTPEPAAGGPHATAETTRSPR